MPDVDDARDVLALDLHRRRAPRARTAPRPRASPSASGRRNLSATFSSSWRWCAATTTPMPPTPSTRSTRYLPARTSPSRTPADRWNRSLHHARVPSPPVSRSGGADSEPAFGCMSSVLPTDVKRGRCVFDCLTTPAAHVSRRWRNKWLWTVGDGERSNARDAAWNKRWTAVSIAKAGARGRIPPCAFGRIARYGISWRTGAINRRHPPPRAGSVCHPLGD